MIDTESESDNPEEYLRKISRTIMRRTERKIAKKVSEECVLRRKLPKRVSRVLAKYPNIGKVMEEFVQFSWRRCVEENGSAHI